MAEFVRVASVDDVKPGEMTEVEYEGEAVCLANVGGTFYAIGGVCTHAGGPLAEGELDEDECTIECPWHAGFFSLKTGEALTPPAYDAVERYEVQIDGNDVKIARA